MSSTVIDVLTNSSKLANLRADNRSITFRQRPLVKQRCLCASVLTSSGAYYARRLNTCIYSTTLLPPSSSFSNSGLFATMRTSGIWKDRNAA